MHKAVYKMLKLRQLGTLLARPFGRLQTHGKSTAKPKEQVKSQAVGDEKFIKLSKKEEDPAKVEQENLERIRRQGMVKGHDMELDQSLNQKLINQAQQYIDQNQIDLVENPLQTYDVLQRILKESVPEKTKAAELAEVQNRERFEQGSVRQWEGLTPKKLKQKREHMNVERFVNEKFKVAPVTPSSRMSRRCGTMGYKIGMTSVYDKWGHLIPLTVIQLDRCQVIRVKEKAKDGVDSMLVGCGERSLKNLRKSDIGQFLKANVPPKLHLSEFKISPENKLPVGYMIGVRHFNVGQFVDVQSKSKGKGFQGVMKRWNFKGLPASHGVSVSHRSPGSTGQRQDPGRVWKKLKMAGRLGNETVIVRKLPVYKIDADRSLLYVKGSVAGPTGRVVRVFDSHYHWNLNYKKLNFPTFIYEKGKQYASVLQVEPLEFDPTENWLHENAVLPDDEEEIAAMSDIADSGPSK